MTGGVAAALTPFSPVDELACYFDTPAEPNTIHLEVRLDGRVDPNLLQSAVLGTLRGYQRARIRRHRWRGWQRRFRWEVGGVPERAPIDTVRWRTGDELAAYRRSLLDAAPPLDSGPPLRIGHAIGPDADVLILNVHHSAMDGLSCLRLLRAIASAYDGAGDLAGDAVVPARAAAGGPVPENAAKTRYLRPATRIARDTADPAPGCGFHLLSLPIGTVHNGLGGSVGTVNDVLIAALILAVEEWNESHNDRSRTIRITMPINARAADTEPLGNLSRLVVIANQPAERRTAPALMTAITRRTAAAKAVRGPQIDIFSRLLATSLLPVAVKARLLTAVRRMLGRAVGDTLLLSNLGRVDGPWSFGAAGVVGMWFSAPARMPAGLSVGVVTLDGRLNLCLRFRLELWDSAAADQFGAMFRQQLAALADPRFAGALAGWMSFP